MQSIEASPTEGKPVSQPHVDWSFGHGEHGQRTKWTTPDDAVWKRNIEEDEMRQRWVVRPAAPRFEAPVDAILTRKVSICDARFVQVGIAVGENSRFAFYVQFDGSHWNGYAPDYTSIERLEKRELEYVLPAPEFSPSPEIQVVTRDIRADLKDTWHSEDFYPKWLTRIRIRGAFKLLFVRII